MASVLFNLSPIVVLQLFYAILIYGYFCSTLYQTGAKRSSSNTRLMTGTMTMMPRSTINRATSPTLRTFSALSSGEKPSPLFRPWRTLSPSRMYVCRPCAVSFTSNALDTVL